MEQKYQLISMTRIISETIKTKKLNEKNTHTHKLQLKQIIVHIKCKIRTETNGNSKKRYNNKKTITQRTETPTKRMRHNGYTHNLRRI